MSFTMQYLMTYRTWFNDYYGQDLTVMIATESYSSIYRRVFSGGGVRRNPTALAVSLKDKRQGIHPGMN
jgi:hypothetical protein